MNFEENKVGIAKVIAALIFVAGAGWTVNAKLNNISDKVAAQIGAVKTQVDDLKEQVSTNHNQIIREMEQRTSDRVTRSMVGTMCNNLDRKSRDNQGKFRCDPTRDLPYYRNTLLPVLPRNRTPVFE